MSSNQQNPSAPFWDFIQSIDPNWAPGRSAHQNSQGPFPCLPAGFPFSLGGSHPQTSGPWAAAESDAEDWNPWAHRGSWRGRHARRQGHGHGHGHGHRQGADGEESCQDPEASAPDAQREQRNEQGDSPETVRTQDTAPDPAEVTPEGSDDQHFRGHCRRGGPGRFGRGGFRRGHHHGPPQYPHGPGHHHYGHHGPPYPPHGPGHHYPHAPPPPPPYSGFGGPFDLGSIINGLSGHPFFRDLREQVDTLRTPHADAASRAAAAAATGHDNDNAFLPPVDTFNTERAYILHIALPGARKEDIGVNWDPDTSTLSIAGVVYRPGDEAFLETLASAERRVGMFERKIVLPPAGVTDKGEIDGLGITAKMEDGLLVVTVPKLEKEWTEIHKVDIE